MRPALERLQEIQQTGDIFFPKNWMDASLTGYNSPQVAETVRAFLKERPDYPVRLRRIILQAADDVFRASPSCQTPTDLRYFSDGYHEGTKTKKVEDRRKHDTECDLRPA